MATQGRVGPRVRGGRWGEQDAGSEPGFPGPGGAPWPGGALGQRRTLRESKTRGVSQASQATQVVETLPAVRETQV